ncbi:MAG: hypothetical protein COY66_05570 [Candidatus Kerfeldbacteria bacterium CG_4_10_14_0_8_um_filter_42_10]|uniref:Peptidase C39-like domain-containing protein n=1 Tax=Candidatus Kerfeldbacteria bacterium CG_4_10_14_0_8_um_filter_42_10 TaxID=2014248 RepID=A0A2M7RH62_9BACT|nr:MAG: hypothetical protein COY66_05570 [Candidatus Kerfeldbacteria bacterium CG_4_10_14_0_8_um_filter_42_10]
MYFKRLLLVIIFGGSAIVFVLNQLWRGPEGVETQARVFAPRITDEESVTNTNQTEQPLLPAEEGEFGQIHLLDVPYTVQAPYAKWDVYDEEACEEAALLMAYEYLKGNQYPQGIIPPADAQTELRRMIDFQVDQLGYEVTTDLFPNQLKTFIESYWSGYTARFISDTSVLKIKQEINRGNPVVIPATAKILNNPWYHYQDYHMLLVIGYEGDQFITNDPGTKRGEDWKYGQDLVIEAIEDSGGEPLVLTKK